MAVIDTLKRRLARARERWPFLDHLVRTIGHYGDVNGSALAAAVTYFAFLSFFPIIALSFAVIGEVSKKYPRARTDLETAINDVLPGIVGNDPGQLSLSSIADSAPSLFSIGILVALYSGLGWLSGMRSALVAVFEEPDKERPGFLLGKLRDVLALLVLGTVLVLSVAVSGVATKLAGPILDLLGLGTGVTAAVWVIGLVLGLAANTVLFFAFFRLLAAPDEPGRSLWSGALLGAVAFEVLKQLSTYLLAATKNADAAQAFGIALILVVWMNYVSRLVVLAAAWAHTSPLARERREQARRPATVSGPVAAAAPPTSRPAASFAAGAASMLALVAVLRKRK